MNILISGAGCKSRVVLTENAALSALRDGNDTSGLPDRQMVAAVAAFPICVSETRQY